MGTSIRELTRWAVVQKGTGKCVRIKNMRHNYQPMLDADRFEALKVGEDVEPGMVRDDGGGFKWPK